jgi:hypothetical protein
MTSQPIRFIPAHLSSIAALSDWFGKSVKPVLEEHAIERIAEFERQLVELDAIGRGLKEPFSACFLGQSQIGKSTLINALVAEDRILLPAGGIGPLTAQAIQVNYSPTPFLEVWYHKKALILRLLFTLERQLDREMASAKESLIPDFSEFDFNSDEQQDLAVLDEAASQTATLDSIKQAALLIAGDQNEIRPLKYLCDGLRFACSMPGKWNTEFEPSDCENIERLASVLKGNGEVAYKAEGAMNDPAFMRESHAHAAGALAPMVNKLDIGWPSPLLKGGVRLVDLPGVGIANDVHGSVTRSWIKEKANAICLVVTNGGIDAASAELLRTSDFLTRLLYSINDPEADPVVLCVVVVRMDALAESSYHQERALSPDSFRKKREHFLDLSERMKGTICAQMKNELQRLAAENDGVAREALNSAGERLVNSLQVFPVSAPEYCKVLRDDEEERSFLRTAEDSGIPRLQMAIQQLASEMHSSKLEKLAKQSSDFRDRVLALLESIRVQWTEDTEEAEAERIRGLLHPFLEPKKRELAARQGKFHEFLETSVPQQIDLLVGKASREAEGAMRRDLRRLQDANWSTLKAVIVRGGAFYGKRPVDLPRDMASRFEEHVAPIWSTSVIGEVRKRTAQLADDYVSLVGKTVAWAEENGARSRSTVVQSLADNIRQEGKRMVQVGRNGADDLREAVKRELQDKIQESIRRKCKKFAESEEARGPGVKKRMLRFFEEDLLDIAITAAQPPTSQILKNNYASVRDEIVECFRQFSNPLEDAELKIVGTHLDAEKRSKAQKRGRVLAGLNSALSIPPSMRSIGETLSEVKLG